jgi:hypothetical protein
MPIRKTPTYNSSQLAQLVYTADTTNQKENVAPQNICLQVQSVIS